MRSRLLIVALLAAPTLGVAACSDSTPADDAGTSSEAGPPEASADSSSTDGANTSDGASTGDASTPDADADAPETSAPIWEATGPEAGAPTVHGTIAAADCTFVLASFQNNPGAPAPPQYTIYLEKKHTAGTSCPEPKGFRFFTRGSYVTPAANLARHLTDKLLVASWNDKLTPSGSAPSFGHLEQIDWTGGSTLHVGAMAVKGSSAGPPAPSISPSALTVTGRDVVFQGSGNFPGSTGAGTDFTATYLLFLQPYAQPATNADSATNM